MKYLIRSVVVGLCLYVAVPSGVQGAESLNPALHEPFTLRVGAYWTSSSKQASSQSVARGTEVVIDFGTLGVDDRYTSPYLDATWRSRGDWQASFGYFRTRNAGTRLNNAEITYEDTTFEAGALLDSEFDIDFYLATVGYSFPRSDTATAGVGVGLHVMDIDVSFAGAGSVSGGPAAVVEAEEAVLAPIPNLWGYGSWALSPRLAVHATAGWLSLRYGRYHGAMFTLSGSLEYRFSDRIGAGFGYRFLDLDLEVDGDHFRHGFDARQHGPYTYLTVGF